MSISNNQKVVLITGCSDGGLGSALAIAFHKTGNYRVIATARNVSKLNDTRKLGIEEIELDVLSSTSLSAAAKKLETLTGNRLDILLNNAGEGYNSPVVDSDLDKVRKTFELNVFSLITVSQAFMPFLLATPGAKLVNQVSIAAVTNVPFQATYGASKAAAMSYTENMRLELAPFDIRVICLMTGSVRTNFFSNHAKSHGAGNDSLPEGSIYRVLPGGIKLLNDPDAVLMEGAEDMHLWAKHVVADLSAKRPPHQIWRGSQAGLVRIACHFPTGLMDGMLKSMSGLDELEKAVKRK